MLKFVPVHIITELVCINVIWIFFAATQTDLTVQRLSWWCVLDADHATVFTWLVVRFAVRKTTPDPQKVFDPTPVLAPCIFVDDDIGTLIWKTCAGLDFHLHNTSLVFLPCCSTNAECKCWKTLLREMQQHFDNALWWPRGYPVFSDQNLSAFRGFGLHDIDFGTKSNQYDLMMISDGGLLFLRAIL